MEYSETQYKTGAVSSIAGAAALAIVALIVLDISTSMIAGSAAAPGTLSAEAIFSLFQRTPYRAFQYLGLINVFEQVLMIPIFLVFFASHRALFPNASTLVVTLFVVSLGIYVANNAAMPLWHLSARYVSAGDEARPLLSSAGEGLLARGEDFTPGSLPGFVLNEAAVLTMLALMLRSRVFGRTTAILGLVGATLLTVYQIAATFAPVVYNSLMPLAMLGGILMLIWYVLMAVKLFRH